MTPPPQVKKFLEVSCTLPDFVERYRRLYLRLKNAMEELFGQQTAFVLALRHGFSAALLQLSILRAMHVSACAAASVQALVFSVRGVTLLCLLHAGERALRSVHRSDDPGERHGIRLRGDSGAAAAVSGADALPVRPGARQHLRALLQVRSHERHTAPRVPPRVSNAHHLSLCAGTTWATGCWLRGTCGWSTPWRSRSAVASRAASRSRC